MQQTESNKIKSKKLSLILKKVNIQQEEEKNQLLECGLKEVQVKYVNGKLMGDYFKRPVHQLIVTRPLEVTNVINNYDVKCSVKGGGLSGQAGAIILGISRALISHDENLKKDLKKDKLTTRDSRVVERKKYGHRKARRSFQFSKR